MIAFALRAIAVSISCDLLVGVVVVNEHQGVVAELLGFGIGAFSLRGLKNGLSCDGVMTAMRPAAYAELPKKAALTSKAPTNA